MIKLIGFSSEGTKYYQEVKVIVGFDKNSTEYNTYRAIEAKIVKISKTGIVDIQFN